MTEEVGDLTLVSTRYLVDELERRATTYVFMADGLAGIEESAVWWNGCAKAVMWMLIAAQRKVLQESEEE